MDTTPCAVLRAQRSGGHTTTPNEHPVTCPSAIIYIDSQRLTRECVAEQLARYLPERLVEATASASELPNYEAKDFAIGIFNKHSTHIADLAVAEELSSLAIAAPDLAVILLSDLDDADEVAEAFKRGIRGFIPTTLPVKQVVEAIRLVGVGGCYLPLSILAQSTLAAETLRSSKIDETRCTMPFTPRQLDILQLLWQGKQNKLIAHDLNMCESTVKVHIRHIMKKLNARNRTQIVLRTRSMYTNANAEILR
jgi:DNA-binding NarL/FixJ family response regulator